MSLVLLSTVLLLPQAFLSERVPTPGLLVEEAKPSLQAMAPEALDQALALARAERPSAVGPVLVMTAGSLGALVGAGVFLFASIPLGAVVLCSAAVVIAAGVVWLVLQAPQREAANARITALTRELQRRAREGAAPRPPTEEGPPPPGVQRDVTPGWRLAQF